MVPASDSSYATSTTGGANRFLHSSHDPIRENFQIVDPARGDGSLSPVVVIGGSRLDLKEKHELVIDIDPGEDSHTADPPRPSTHRHPSEPPSDGPPGSKAGLGTIQEAGSHSQTGEAAWRIVGPSDSVPLLGSGGHSEIEELWLKDEESHGRLLPHSSSGPTRALPDLSIHTTSKRLGRAFSKQQLLRICQNIQATTPTPTPTTRFNSKSHSKQDLISFILFKHWALTNPIDIPTDHSFHSLLKNFRANHQSHQLSYHELFLLQLDQAKERPTSSLIDRLAQTTHVTINLSLEHLQLTILGQMKDRQRFWTEFERTRRPVYRHEIPLTTHQLATIPLDNRILLSHLAELSNCSLEFLSENHPKKILVAYAFDQHNLAERVSDVLERYAILASEYDHTPTLIDLQPEPDRRSPEAASSSSLGFLPFSHPFQPDWPHHLTFDQKSLSRLSAPSSNPAANTLVDDGGAALDPHLPPAPMIDLHGLLASSFPVLTSPSSADSITLHDWISSSFPTQDGSLECRVYHGHYVRSKDPAGPLLDQASMILLPTHDEQAGTIVKQLRSFWTSNRKTSPPSPTRRFIFLKSPRHPVESGMLAKPPSVGEGDSPPSREPREDQAMPIMYEVVQQEPRTPSLLDDQSATGADQQGVGSSSSDGEEEVRRKRVVILRPRQSTDLMVEVDPRKRPDGQPSAAAGKQQDVRDECRDEGERSWPIADRSSIPQAESSR
ncbi:hypothetical protein PTTG_26328 [Puccinia triticina 1-1 BBBD Race 1]|uniref:Uncharacterized protein n=1 Tax=Puccinia triticina (isolate 1-1 / race 1 (BBBD)) TaxID=630390 RepID=A0A180GUQ6_PUCT1|nr:hypothetical protein PTTG_26328 [Puccinia triticina 1-1 BBBD Race 1]